MPKTDKPKLLSGKKLTKALDDTTRQLMHLMYGENPACFVCGHHDYWWNWKTHPNGIQVGHFIHRQTTILRWNFLNLWPQCSGCNIVHNTNPVPFTLAIEAKYGVSRLILLDKMQREGKGKKFPDSVRREWLADLKEQVSRLMEDNSLTSGSQDAMVVA